MGIKDFYVKIPYLCEAQKCNPGDTIKQGDIVVMKERIK